MSEKGMLTDNDPSWFMKGAQGIDDFVRGLFTRDKKEYEKEGYNDYASWWLNNRPDKAWFTSPIFPGGFDEEGYDEAFNEWISKKPLSGFPSEMD